MPPEITEFDKLIYNDSVCMLKESLPYIDIATQKSFAIIIMFMEMENMINVYENDTDKIKKFCKNGSVNDLINTMEKHCNSDNRKNIQQLKQILNTFKNYEKYKDIINPDILNNLFNTQSTSDKKSNSNQTNDNNLYNMLFNMMSKEQKEMFETYKSMF